MRDNGIDPDTAQFYYDDGVNPFGPDSEPQWYVFNEENAVTGTPLVSWALVGAALTDLFTPSNWSGLENDG